MNDKYCYLILPLTRTQPHAHAHTKQQHELSHTMQRIARRMLSAQHRPLPSTVDHIIVGGGIAGCSASVVSSTSVTPWTPVPQEAARRHGWGSLTLVIGWQHDTFVLFLTYCTLTCSALNIDGWCHISFSSQRPSRNPAPAVQQSSSSSRT